MSAAVLCYSCGDPEAGTYVDRSTCGIPTEGSNSTEIDETKAKKIACENEICYVRMILQLEIYNNAGEYISNMRILIQKLNVNNKFYRF